MLQRKMTIFYMHGLLWQIRFFCGRKKCTPDCRLALLIKFLIASHGMDYCKGRTLNALYFNFKLHGCPEEELSLFLLLYS